MRSHRRIRSMASLLLVALLLSGCQIGNTKVVFLKPVGYHQVFKIDKERFARKKRQGLSDQLYEYLRQCLWRQPEKAEIRTGRFRAVCERFDNITAF